MKQPAKEQIREFWGICGLKRGTCGWMYDPAEPLRPIFPPIDLNNLFKVAVPQAIDKIMTSQECSSDLAYAILFKKWLEKLQVDIPNYEGTLFWVLWEVKEEL